MKGHVGVVRMLLSEFGADVAVCINKGDTALNLAALNGHAEVVGVLISEFGCSPSVRGFEMVEHLFMMPVMVVIWMWWRSLYQSMAVM